MIERRKYRPFRGTPPVYSQEVDAFLAKMARVHNVHAQVRILKDRVRHAAYENKAQLDRELDRLQPWFMPGHWSYSAALGVIAAVFVALLGVLAWLLFGSPTLGA